jgi:hypothetical protein
MRVRRHWVRRATTATATSPTKPRQQQPRLQHPLIATSPTPMGPRNPDDDVPDPNTRPLPPSTMTTPAQDASAIATSPPDRTGGGCHVTRVDERQQTQPTTTTTTSTSIWRPPPATSPAYRHVTGFDKHQPAQKTTTRRPTATVDTMSPGLRSTAAKTG